MAPAWLPPPTLKQIAQLLDFTRDAILRRVVYKYLERVDDIAKLAICQGAALAERAVTKYAAALCFCDCRYP